MYALPMLGVANRVLKIDPTSGTAHEVGADLRPLIGEVHGDGLAYMHTVEGPDGCLYGPPCSATCVLRFDPRTTEASAFGQLKDPVPYNYHEGVLGPTGRYIFAIPCLASRVLCIDIEKFTVDLIGDDFGPAEGDSYIRDSKWSSGTLAGDDCIYAFPYAPPGTHMLRIDPAAKTASLFGPRLQGVDRVAQFGWTHGNSAAMDGCLYGAPHCAKHILRVDPFAGTVSTLNEVFPPSLMMKLVGSVVDNDGAIWFTPVNAPTRMFRMGPRPPRTDFLSTLSQSEHHALLLEGLTDYRCYALTLVVELWRESVRPGGDSLLVCKLLNAVATVLPAVITTSFKTDKGLTARMLLKTIVAVLPLQVCVLPITIHGIDVCSNTVLTSWQGMSLHLVVMPVCVFSLLLTRRPHS